MKKNTEKADSIIEKKSMYYCSNLQSKDKKSEEQIIEEVRMQTNFDSFIISTAKIINVMVEDKKYVASILPFNNNKDENLSSIITSVYVDDATEKMINKLGVLGFKEAIIKKDFTGKVLVSDPNVTRIDGKEIMFDATDKIIFDAVLFFKVIGKDKFTARDVIKHYTALLETDHFSKEREEAIDKRIKILMNVGIMVDKRVEYEVRGIIMATRIKAEREGDYLLPIVSYEWEYDNGVVVHGYRICQDSSLFNYILATHQIATYKKQHIEKISLRIDDEQAVLQDYILLRIHAMKGNKKLSRRIAIETYSNNLGLHGWLGITPDMYAGKAWANKRKKIIGRVQDVLERQKYLKYISSFSLVL